MTTHDQHISNDPSAAGGAAPTGRPEASRAQMPGQGQPVQGQPGQGQPAQGQPVQGQPVQGQPGQGQPAQGQQVHGDQPVRGDQRTVGDQPRTQTSAAQPGTAADRSSPGTQTSGGDSLFGSEGRSGLSARWDDVQAGFVDNPKQSVEKADALVAEVVDHLTATFSQTRSTLEAHWSRGEDASTEDLRVALQRYREFFQRLLSV